MVVTPFSTVPLIELVTGLSASSNGTAAFNVLIVNLAGSATDTTWFFEVTQTWRPGSRRWVIGSEMRSNRPTRQEGDEARRSTDRNVPPRHDDRIITLGITRAITVAGPPR